jgi:hypothetical protein
MTTAQVTKKPNGSVYRYYYIVRLELLRDALQDCGVNWSEPLAQAATCLLS